MVMMVMSEILMKCVGVFDDTSNGSDMSLTGLMPQTGTS